MVDVILGLQWGDEGKGKIVDYFAPKYDIIARFQGGPNAGHTLYVNGTKMVLHQIPSGIFHQDKINIIGNGVVLDPVTLKKECDAVATMGVDVKKNLFISERTNIIIPSHRALDKASELSKGEAKIGSTLKGIGPTYMDKTGRNGLRVGDTQLPDFKERYQKLVNKHLSILAYYGDVPDFSEKEQAFFEAIEALKAIPQVDGEHFVNQYLQQGKKVLAEGAQGTMLDVDFGSYPFVTSSNTTTAGACTGLGVAPKNIGKVIGIFKAYCTRVGGGPFPTELENETGEKLRAIGHEFGATTGRPRRCGWIDLPALKYAILLNGVSEMVMTKADVLSGFDTIYACTHYQYNGETIDYMPYDINALTATPVFEAIPGWNEDLTGIRAENEIPSRLKNYIAYLEKHLEVPVRYLSVGPDREQTLILS